MTDSYTQVGDDLFTFVSGLNITGIYPGGWAHAFNKPYRPEDVTTGEYPYVMVLPAEDQTESLDSATDTDQVTYWVHIADEIQTSLYEGEDNIRALADLVRNALRAERLSPTPLGSDAYDLSISGQWGWDNDSHERFYRCVVTVRIAQDL